MCRPRLGLLETHAVMKTAIQSRSLEVRHGLFGTRQLAEIFRIATHERTWIYEVLTAPQSPWQFHTPNA